MRASAEHDTVALVMLDLDDFKKVNDVYGHGVGDQLLLQVADVLRASVRASDVVCRIGGEEFAIIIPSGDLRSAIGLAERVGAELGKLEVEAAGRLTVSTGVAVGPGARGQPARARRLRGGGDDDRQDPRQRAHRPVRRERRSSARRRRTRAATTCARSRT